MGQGECLGNQPTELLRFFKYVHTLSSQNPIIASMLLY